MAAFRVALHSQVDCIKTDVSRSSDGILLVLHDRDLQRMTGDRTTRVGHLTAREMTELKPFHQSIEKFDDVAAITLEQALMLVSRSVHQVILDAKVGPPSFEDGLAEDILSVVGHIVMEDPSMKMTSSKLDLLLSIEVPFHKGMSPASVVYPLLPKLQFYSSDGQNSNNFPFNGGDRRMYLHGQSMTSNHAEDAG